MKYYKLIIIFLIAVIIQPTLLNIISIMDTTPSLILALVVVITMLYDEEIKVLLTGVISGVLLNLTNNMLVGITGISIVIIWIITMMYKHVFNVENKLSVIPISLVSTVLFQIVHWVGGLIFGMPTGVIEFLKFMPVSIVYNMLLIFVLYMLFFNNSVKVCRQKRIDLL